MVLCIDENVYMYIINIRDAAFSFYFYVCMYVCMYVYRFLLVTDECISP